MKPGTCLTAMLAALALTGCASSTGSALRPDLAEPPAGLTRHGDPVAVSGGSGADGGIDQARVVALWAKDRAALVACKRRHQGLRAFYGVRDAALR